MAKADTTLKADWISKGKKKYTAGIENFGIENYAECGLKGGMDTAVCLKTKKIAAASVKAWADAWETAMEGE